MKVKRAKNKVLPRERNSKMSKIDIKNGELTFSQRIELGRIAASDVDEFEKAMEMWRCLYVDRPKLTEKNVDDFVRDVKEIIDGLNFWIERETKALKYEPTADEKRAGISELSKNVGEYGTILAIAETYGKDPDEVLKWKYGKIFGILYTDLERHKFQQRLSKEITRK